MKIASYDIEFRRPPASVIWRVMRREFDDAENFGAAGAWIALCWPEAPVAPWTSRSLDEDLVRFGERVGDYLVEQGASMLDVLNVGGKAMAYAIEIMGIPDDEEVKGTTDFSEESGGPSSSDSPSQTDSDAA